jgi:hypothetical protein
VVLFCTCIVSHGDTGGNTELVAELLDIELMSLEYLDNKDQDKSDKN